MPCAAHTERRAPTERELRRVRVELAIECGMGVHLFEASSQAYCNAWGMFEVSFSPSLAARRVNLSSRVPSVSKPFAAHSCQATSQSESLLRTACSTIAWWIHRVQLAVGEQPCVGGIGAEEAVRSEPFHVFLFALVALTPHRILCARSQFGCIRLMCLLVVARGQMLAT